MSKRKRDTATSFGSSEESSSPHISDSKSKSEDNSDHPPPTDEEKKEWDDVKCPVCMDHPHNAVLLICSSHTKGCRPYMCDTSNQELHCFRQFCKSCSQAPSATPWEHEVGKAQALDNFIGMHKLEQRLMCPLCRGLIRGWIVAQSARDYMNFKIKGCASENCDFIGSYTDLRKHSRLRHPHVRPSMADSERRLNWTPLLRERETRDLHSIIRSSPRHQSFFEIQALEYFQINFASAADVTVRSRLRTGANSHTAFAVISWGEGRSATGQSNPDVQN